MNGFKGKKGKSGGKDFNRYVQSLLKKRGVYSGRLDGIVGNMTRDALSNFQRQRGLKVTGTTTDETLTALKDQAAPSPPTKADLPAPVETVSRGPLTDNPTFPQAFGEQPDVSRGTSMDAPSQVDDPSIDLDAIYGPGTLARVDKYPNVKQSLIDQATAERGDRVDRLQGILDQKAHDTALSEGSGNPYEAGIDPYTMSRNPNLSRATNEQGGQMPDGVSMPDQFQAPPIAPPSQPFVPTLPISPRERLVESLLKHQLGGSQPQEQSDYQGPGIQWIDQFNQRLRSMGIIR